MYEQIESNKDPKLPKTDTQVTYLAKNDTMYELSTQNQSQILNSSFDESSNSNLVNFKINNRINQNTVQNDSPACALVKDEEQTLLTSLESSSTSPTSSPFTNTQSQNDNNENTRVISISDVTKFDLIIVNNSKNVNKNKKCLPFSKFSISDVLSDIRCFTFFMCLIVMLTNALTVGYRNSVITTIEKRFEFSSVYSGILSGCLEIGSLVTTLFVSYFCANSHIPKCIALSSLMCSLGSFMYSLPHLLSGSYTINKNVMNKTNSDLLCKIIRPLLLNLTAQTTDSNAHLSPYNADTTISLLNPFDLNSDCLLKANNIGYFLILILANVLIGSSSAPLYTLGTAYIDNHVDKDNSSVYLAFIYSMLAFGPLVGYLAGAGFLQVYVDGLSFSIKDLHPGDSNWIGAWFIGFILFGVLLFITAFPFFFFPKKMRKNYKQPATAEQELNKDNSSEENNFGNLETLPKAIKNIVFNRVFILVSLAFCFEITIISGFMTFLPKYIEHQFSFNNSMANIYTGGVAIPGACIGIVAGGFLVKKFKIDPKGAALMAISCNIICLFGIIVLIFTGCPNIIMAGTTVAYPNTNTVEIGAFDLASNCNYGCQCSSSSIEPICGSDGITYFSPCHAGCTQFNDLLSDISKKQTFSSCKCIKGHLRNNTILSDAQSGPCPIKCGTFVPFLGILFFITFLTALNQMPMLMVTLRSVTEIERPFALGVQLVIMRLLAYIPSPLIFGQAIDWTCLVWHKDECNKTGSCLLYDREKFRNVYGSIAAVYKAISLLLFFFLYLSARNYSYNQKPLEMSVMLKASVTSLNTAHHKNNDNKSNTNQLNNGNTNET